MSGLEKRAVEELIRLAKRSHDTCEDPWYNCPKSEEPCLNDAAGSECNCGADNHNALVQAIASRLGVKS